MNTIQQRFYQELGIDFIYLGEEAVNKERLSCVLNKEKHQEETHENSSNKKIPHPQTVTHRKEMNPRIPVHKKESIKEIAVKKETTKVVDIHVENQPSVFTGIIRDIPDLDIRFQEISAKMRRTPCVWTYYELGEDIFGEASQSRRNAIKEILTTLAMPQGTHSFLPFTAPDAKGILQTHREDFFSILNIYKPSLVIILGSAGVDTLIDSQYTTYWKEFLLYPPVRCVILPSFEEIANQRDKIIRAFKEYIKKTGLYV